MKATHYLPHSYNNKLSGEFPRLSSDFTDSYRTEESANSQTVRH